MTEEVAGVDFAGVDNDGGSCRVDFAGVDFAGVDNDGGSCRSGQCRSGQ